MLSRVTAKNIGGVFRQCSLLNLRAKHIAARRIMHQNVLDYTTYGRITQKFSWEWLNPVPHLFNTPNRKTIPCRVHPYSENPGQACASQLDFCSFFIE